MTMTAGFIFFSLCAGGVIPSGVSDGHESWIETEDDEHDPHCDEREGDLPGAHAGVLFLFGLKGGAEGLGLGDEAARNRGALAGGERGTRSDLDHFHHTE